MSDSLRPHRQQPTRFLCPWDSPGKNIGVGCHFLLQCIKLKNESEVVQSRPISSDPMDCTLPGSSVHGIFQARILEWGCHFLLQIEISSPKWRMSKQIQTPYFVQGYTAWEQRGIDQNPWPIPKAMLCHTPWLTHRYYSLTCFRLEIYLNTHTDMHSGILISNLEHSRVRDEWGNKHAHQTLELCAFRCGSSNTINTV